MAAIGVAVLGAVVACAFLLARMNDVSLSALTRDAATTADLPWYTGALSTAGVVMWATGSGIAVFAGWVLAADETRLLRGLGMLGMVLAVDDALLIHEHALPELFGTGAAEIGAYAVYGAAFVTVVVRNRAHLRGPGAIVFVIGSCFLGASVAVDAVVSLPAFSEDSLKIVGIFGWSAALVLRSAAVLRARSLHR